MKGTKAIIIITIILIICALSLAYVIYFTMTGTSTNISVNKQTEEEPIVNVEAPEFDSLFDNTLNYQKYPANPIKLIDNSKGLLYTIYRSNQRSEGKYDINVELPYININNEKVNEINKEIILTFGQKVQSILNTPNINNTIYTVEYTAYINNNILSVVIRSTLKEGNNAQRTMIKTYNYDLLNNKTIPLKTLIEERLINISFVKVK